VAARAACEVNIGAARSKRDQPRGWLSRDERMRFCINLSVDGADTSCYKKRHKLAHALGAAERQGAATASIHSPS
jgi:hypothetical protein